VALSYCCAIHCLPRNLVTHGAERSEGNGGEARRGSTPMLLRNRVPRGFWSLTAPAWGEYATIFFCRCNECFVEDQLLPSSSAVAQPHMLKRRLPPADS
jgi:hypothetical protein